MSLRNIVALLTGGRPMKRRCHAFMNAVSGQPVFYYEDAYGRLWMAESRWDLFRVRANSEEA